MIRSLSAYMAKAIDRPLRFGRLGKPKDVQGFWRVHDEVVRARSPNDVAFTAHEIGHGLEKLGKADIANAPGNVIAELEALGKALYGKKKPQGGVITMQ